MKTIENIPNAERLIESLRYSGYSNEAAVADLVDNSLDAGAMRIEINITDDKITIKDNGTGMDYPTMDQAIRLGSRVEHATGDLGKFGMGLITASISLGRRLEVITCDGTEAWKMVQDLDNIAKEKEFVREQEKLKAVNLSYTTVEISKIDRMTYKTETTVGRIKNYLGQTFRHYLWSGRVITVNGVEIDPIDPLWSDHKETYVHSDEIYEFAGGTVRLKFVLLPRLTSELADNMKINAANQGIYVVRNNREIMTAQTFGLWAREFKNNRVRIELQFSDDLDEIFGVNFSKQGIKPTQKAIEWMRSNINSTRQHLRNQAEKDRKLENEDVPDHSESEKVITSKIPLLVMPAAQREKRDADSKSSDSEKEQQKDDPTRTRTPKKLQDPNSPASRVNIGQGHHGPLGPLYYAYPKGRTVVVEWNYDHPFFERMVMKYKDDKDALAGLNFIVYSLATAELRIMNEDDQAKVATIEHFRSDFSGNLRALMR